MRDAKNVAQQQGELRVMYLYVTALYFISTTSTTVGYGDFGGKTDHEMLFLIVVEFAGICIFSIITGLYQQLIRVRNIHEIVVAKTNDITIYLQSVDNARKEAHLDSLIYDNIIDYIKKSYLYGVVQSLKKQEDFYQYFSPELKNKLVFTLLDSYYKKFFFFFNDVNTQNFADPLFVRKMLSAMDCAIFLEGSTVVECGKHFTDMYFNFKGSITVIDQGFKF